MKFNAETIVKLLQVKGIGRGKIFKLAELLTFYPSDDKELAGCLIDNSAKLNITCTSNEIFTSFSKGEELFQKSFDLGVKILGFWDSNFPSKLKEIQNPPVLINVRGDITNLINMPCTAVIGTREPSNYGRSIGERLGYRLGENNINVVSGLAKGCDTAAHIGCLKANGITTAILGHGLDYIYPKENLELSNIILEKDGCLISEYLIRTRAQPSFFVDRDRLQSGLSVATIVIETGTTGGTMHAVRATLESNKILAVFKHPIDKQNDKSKGNEQLLKEGKAIGLQSKEDIDNLIRKIKPNLNSVRDAYLKTAKENDITTNFTEDITNSNVSLAPSLILESNPTNPKKKVQKQATHNHKAISEEEKQAYSKLEQAKSNLNSTKNELGRIQADLKKAKQNYNDAVKLKKIAEAELKALKRALKNKDTQIKLL